MLYNIKMTTRSGRLYATETYTTLSNGTQEWRMYKKLHRDDGPAVIRSDHTQIWYRRGEMHRDNDEPAYIGSDGKQIWCQYNFIHRDNGPAIIYSDNPSEWWKKGKRIPTPSSN